MNKVTLGIALLASWLGTSGPILAVEVPPLVIVVTAQPFKSFFGELGKESETHVEVLDLKTGEAQSFLKKDLQSIKKDVAESTAIDRVGLTTFMTWRVNKILPAAAAKGKIAQLDGATVYVTIGSSVGLENGKELLVYRGNNEIKDPDTGKVLGKQRRKLAKLIVTETEESFAKAKLIGDLEVGLLVGDVVEPTVVSNAVAILPFVDFEGNETAGTRRIAEELTTGLVNRGVSIVERRLLDTVLSELGLQQSGLFDSAKAQQIGKQLGAYAIIIGTVAPKNNIVEAQIRLVRVETGEILAAATQIIRNGVEQRSEAPARPNQPRNNMAKPIGKLIKGVDLLDPNNVQNWKFVGDGQGNPFQFEPSGVLICHSDRGDGKLFYDVPHNDCHLTVEWRFTSDGNQTPRGGGVMILADSTQSQNLGIEIQLGVQDTGDLYVGTQTTLDTLPMVPGAKRRPAIAHNEKPLGEWNVLEVSCRAGNVEIKSNGQVVNRGQNGSRRKGQIGLLAQRSDIEYRRIVLNDIGK